MTKILTLDEIFATNDLDTKTVHVPEWGGNVTVKGLSKREQQLLRKQATDPLTSAIDPDRMEMLMLAHCLASPVITIEQAEQLMQKSATAVDKVLTAIMDVTGLSDTAQKAMVRTFHAGAEES